jgi:phosphoglycerate dehydrogenase-like enzyme
VRILVAIYSPFEAWCIPGAQVARLRREFPEYTFVHASSDDEALAGIADADVAFGARLRPEQIAAAPRLRWVHSPAAGIGNMLFPAMVESPIQLTNSRGIASVPIAEHVLAVTLAWLRDLPLAWQRQAERVWSQNEYHARPAPRTLRDSRVLVVGLGSIGSEVARLAAAFGAHVVGIRRRLGQSHEHVMAVRSPDALHKELPLADVVVIAAPQTPATHQLFGARELSMLKDGAVLVNVSRGKLIDEDALAVELARGRIRAALDVFEHEPLPSDSPLWRVPGLLVTPHVAGFGRDYVARLLARVRDNVARLDRGEPLLGEIDRRVGY